MEHEIHQACLATLDRFMAALNRYDSAGMDAEMHFPHVRMAEGKVVIYDGPGLNPMDLFDRLRLADRWKFSEWGNRDLMQFNEVKAHYALDYTRFRDDGSIIGVYKSLYVLTKVAGRWGILARSSFGP